MIIPILIYLAGYIVAYYSLRKIIKGVNPAYYNWGDVIIIGIFSLFSWVTVGIILLAAAGAFIIHLGKKLPKNNPPKWL